MDDPPTSAPDSRPTEELPRLDGNVERAPNSRPAEGIPQLDGDVERALSNVERTLRCHRIVLGLPTFYVGLMEELVFSRQIAASRKALADDRKAVKSLKRVLTNSETCGLLQLVWKESEFVSDEDLVRQGYSRVFVQGSLTCHALAKLLAETADRLPAMNKHVANIIEASVAYGLVEERFVSRVKTLITGTSLLNQFMLTLSERQSDFLNSQLQPKSNGRFPK